MDMHEDIGKILLTEEEIKARVRELGTQLKQDYAGKEVVVIALLKGAAYFATDLTLAMDMPVKIDFMVASSYGNRALIAAVTSVLSLMWLRNWRDGM